MSNIAKTDAAGHFVRDLLIAVFAAASLWLLLHAATRLSYQAVMLDGQVYSYVQDDVLITLRVARNIAHGLGPYFNPSEHLAANTSLIWPYLLAVPAKLLSQNQLVSMAGSLTVLFAIGTAGVIVASAAAPLPAFLCVAAFTLSPSVAYYAPSGWEHVPEAFFLALGTAFLLGRLGRNPCGFDPLDLGYLCFGAAFLIRPDAMLFLLAPGVLLVQRLVIERTRGHVVALAAVVFGVAGYYLLHHALYGSFVPNTYFLKASSGATSVERGLGYIAANLADSGISLFILAALFFSALAWRRLSAATWAIVASLVLHVAYVVHIGGDFFPFGRMLLAVLPVSLILLTASWERASRSFPRSSAIAIALLAVLAATQLDVQVARSASVSRFSTSGTGAIQADPMSDSEDDLMRSQVLLAGVLSKHLQPEDGPIGVFLAGAIPYYMPNYRFADFYGKADEEIAHGPARSGPVAHNKWNLDITLDKRRPVAIVMPVIGIAEAERSVQQSSGFTAMSALRIDPRFSERFVFLSPEQIGVPGRWGIAIRKDIASRFVIANTSPGK